MTPSTKKKVKWGSAIFTIVWILAVGLDQFGEFGAFDYGKSVREEQIQRQLKTCKGSFQYRYNCKSAILRAHGRDTFNYWGTKLGYTFGPALLIYMIFNLWLRRVEWNEESERRRKRIIRIERKRQKDSRFATEEGRQRTQAALRRQNIKKVEKEAQRKEMERPLNVMVVSQDELLIDKLTPRYFDQGYNLIGTDLRDVFLSYKEIGYHLILIENESKEPELHKDDVGDHDFPGLPLPVIATINKLRERKENVRVVSWAPEYVGKSEVQLEQVAAALGTNAAIGKPGELEEVVALFKRLLDRKGGDDESSEDQPEVEV